MNNSLLSSATLKWQTPAQRDAVVVTHVTGPDGQKHPVSLYGDTVWDFTPFFPHAARPNADKTIDWNRAPKEWVTSLKDALATFIVIARPGGIRLDPATLPKRFVTLNAFAKWCSTEGIHSFRDVSAFAVARYVSKLRDDGLYDRSIASHVTLLRRVYDMRDYLRDSFERNAARELSTDKLGALWEPDADEARRTEVFPISEAAELFSRALETLERAPDVLRLRDELESDEQLKKKRKDCTTWRYFAQRQRIVAAGYKDVLEFESRLVDIRTAAYIVLAQSTGCRVHELGEIGVGCVTPEDIGGITYYWLLAATRKVGDAPQRWLAPRVAVDAVKVLEWLSAPLREENGRRLNVARTQYSKLSASDASSKALALKIIELERNVDRLFLSVGKGGVISSTPTHAHNKQLNAFARRAGIALSIPAHTHRFRRTYAVIVVRMNKGARIDLVTLKHHFKHASVLMSEWYSSLSGADRELLDIIDEEVDYFDIGLLEHWFDPETRLAGGLGGRIKAYAGRHHQPMVFPTRKEFLESVRDGLSIRATGHGWCLSEGKDCGGQGLFEASRCSDCGNSVIDESQLEIWQGIHRQQQELLNADDIGVGGREKVRRALAASSAVLERLLGTGETAGA